MKYYNKIFVLFMLFFMFFGILGEAQQVSRPGAGHKGTWRILGTTQAKHSADHDVIIVLGPFYFWV